MAETSENYPHQKNKKKSQEISKGERKEDTNEKSMQTKEK
ncbi:unnamed protein product [Nyctereutes procyonoides]|uniref:(raccoon dog) hypothetical protein n=1 Tax=Nyctereutes procyonoides TaxID=34880 RepID=A0A812A1A0_NYCPR|nr:unnamed protein product [Nyctereutes procyonoides]